MPIVLTEDQESALQAVLAWQQGKPGSPSSPDLLRLGGYAGTGKTTVIAEFRKALPGQTKVAFCAFTGKASQVLKRKLEEGDAVFDEDHVSTIHSLIYEPSLDEDGKIRGWNKRNELPFELIVVDEASMVGRDIFKDLTSFGVPIFAVGDHGQLKPISQDFSLMEDPDIALEKIHRQAEDNPIIQLSLEVRRSGRIPVGKFGKNVKKMAPGYARDHLPDILSLWNEESLFLVSTNQQRVQLNRQIRHAQGFTEPLNPVSGDRVICLRNDWIRGLYNGLTGQLTSLQPKEDHWYLAEVDLEDGRTYQGPMFRSQFHATKTIDEYPGLRPSEIGPRFDFGYAMTVHKAQGSQAHRVVLFENRHSYMTDDDWRRWLYTAVTRAEEELLIF